MEESRKSVLNELRSSLFEDMIRLRNLVDEGILCRKVYLKRCSELSSFIGMIDRFK